MTKSDLLKGEVLKRRILSSDGRSGDSVAMGHAACVHFSRFAHLVPNVGHKSEVTRPAAPLAADKIPNCFLAPGGRRPRFALKRRFKLHL